MHRDGLRTALAGRDDVLLEPILQLLVKFIADARFGDLAGSVAGIVLGVSYRANFECSFGKANLYNAANLDRYVCARAWPIATYRRIICPLAEKGGG